MSRDEGGFLLVAGPGVDDHPHFTLSPCLLVIVSSVHSLPANLSFPFSTTSPLTSLVHSLVPLPLFSSLLFPLLWHARHLHSSRRAPGKPRVFSTLTHSPSLGKTHALCFFPVHSFLHFFWLPAIEHTQSTHTHTERVRPGLCMCHGILSSLLSSAILDTLSRSCSR